MFCARETVIGLDDLPRQARDQHMQQKFLKARPRLAAASASTWRDRGWGADLRRGGTNLLAFVEAVKREWPQAHLELNRRF